VLATEWANLTLAGAFLGGLAVGVLASLRMAKLLANYLIQLHRDAKEPPDLTGGSDPGAL